MTSTNQIYNTRRYYYVQVNRQNFFTSQLLSQDPQLVLLLGPSSTVPPTCLFQDLRCSYPFDPQTLLSLLLLPTFLPHTAFFSGRSEWLRDSCKLLPHQGFPARVGVALPCSRWRRVFSSKITNKNKCIFSHGPTILIFPLQLQSKMSMMF